MTVLEASPESAGQQKGSAVGQDADRCTIQTFRCKSSCRTCSSAGRSGSAPKASGGEQEDPFVVACHWGDHERAVVPGLREGVCDCGLLASGEHILMLLSVVIIRPGSYRLRTSKTTTRRKRMA